MRILAFAAIAAAVAILPVCADARPQWTPAQANAWYARQPWQVGSNFVPSDAINQLEMWQADSFNPALIDRELGYAEKAGLSVMRVYLHDMLWEADAKGYEARIRTYLDISEKHHIKTLFVLFDSCWDPHPKLGKQPLPRPGLHNPGWVQSPGIDRLRDKATYPALEAYVKGVVGAFARDERVIGWDVWNEPHEDGGADTIHTSGAGALVTALLPKVFDWAQSADPAQPLISGVYDGGDWTPDSKVLNAIQTVQLTRSDVISFHNYSWPEDFERRIKELQAYGRPVWCTEYLARSAGSTIDTILPIAKRYKVAMYNWGLVDGKTQTRFPWDSYAHPYTDREPVVWFHDLFRTDGTPYRQREIEIIRELTAKP